MLLKLAEATALSPSETRWSVLGIRLKARGEIAPDVDRGRAQPYSIDGRPLIRACIGKAAGVPKPGVHLALPPLGLDLAKSKFNACLPRKGGKDRHKVFPNNPKASPTRPSVSAAGTQVLPSSSHRHVCDALALICTGSHLVSVVNLRPSKPTRIAICRTQDRPRGRRLDRLFASERNLRRGIPDRQGQEFPALVLRLHHSSRRTSEETPFVRIA